MKRYISAVLSGLSFRWHWIPASQSDDLRLGSAYLRDFEPSGTRPRESFQESSRVVRTVSNGGSSKKPQVTTRGPRPAPV